MRGGFPRLREFAALQRSPDAVQRFDVRSCPDALDHPELGRLGPVSQRIAAGQPRVAAR